MRRGRAPIAAAALAAAIAAGSTASCARAVESGDAEGRAAAQRAAEAAIPTEAAPRSAVADAAGPNSRSVVFRLSPPGASLVEAGAALELSSGANGTKLGLLKPGRHFLVLAAPGYDSRLLDVGVGEAVVEVQEKLERSGSPLRLAGMASTGRRPKSVAYTPDGRYILAPLLSGRGTDLFDASTLERAGRLEPPEAYARIEGFVESAVVMSLREIWVSQMYNSQIHAFDLDSFAYKDSFPSGGSYPKVIAVSPDGSRAYVSNWVSEDLSVIDTATRKLAARIKLGGTPRGLAASSDGAYLYIARFEGGSILRLRLSDMSLETFYAPDGGAKRHLVLDEERGRLYATDMIRDSLFAFDLNTGSRIAEVKLGPNPNTCALSPDGRTIYACTRGTNNAEDYEKDGPDAGELVAVDAASFRVLARQWGGDQPTGLAVSPDGKRIVFSDFLDMRLEAYDLVGPMGARP